MSHHSRSQEPGVERSPVHTNHGLTHPYDGEQAGCLTYDARLRMWVYVASYDVWDLAQRRARALQDGLHIPFLTVRIGEPAARADRRGREPRYIPGWYAATYADPRPQSRA